MTRTRMAGPGVVDTIMMDFGKVDGANSLACRSSDREPDA